MYSFLFSHRSSRSPLVLFFFSTSLSHHFLMHTQFSLSHFSSPHFSLFFLFSHLHYNVFNMYKALFTLCTPHFEIFPMIMFLALFLTHSLSPFARNKSSNRCVLFPFSFFQYGPPVTPVTLSMQEKKTKEGRIKRRRERKTKKKERYNAITQIRKSIAYSSRHKCARDCSRLLGS